jgi:dTDP-4-amino-4,6-dideoxygalactose transaminase
LLRPGDESSRISAFELAFAEFIGVAHAIMMPSARFGFHQLLRGWGFGPGDEIVIPALTYFAIPGLAVTAGCTPVFADVGASTYTLDPDAFEAAITPNTRAVVPTHLFGLPAQMDRIRAIAAKHDIRVIEDCAQATGATFGRKRVGSLGDAAYYTFGLTKNITTLKGAMVTTDDEALADRVRADIARSTPLARRDLLRELATGTAMMVATHPWVYPFTVHPAVRIGNALGDDPIHDRFGETEHVSDELSPRYFAAGPRAAQAAVGLTQLTRIDDLNARRRHNGLFLDEHLVHIPGLIRPTWPSKASPIFMSYVIQHPQRAELADALRRRGVDTTTGYMTDASTNPLFEAFARDCPNATAAAHSLLHLPVHPNLSSRDLHHISEAVRFAAIEVET